jgi:hypothetical protein
LIALQSFYSHQVLILGRTGRWSTLAGANEACLSPTPGSPPEPRMTFAWACTDWAAKCSRRCA